MREAAILLNYFNTTISRHSCLLLLNKSKKIKKNKENKEKKSRGLKRKKKFLAFLRP